MKKVISLLMLVVVLLAACSGGGGGADGSFVRASAEPETLDLALMSYSQTFDIAANNYTGVYEVAGDGSLQLSGAESVDVSEDGLTYTVKLKEGLKWVDSTGAEKGEVTAQDYLFGYERILTPDTGAVMSYLLQGVLVGANDMLSGEGSFEDVGVKALDDYTLEYKLNYPAPYFEGMLAFPTYYPQPKGASEEYGADYGTSPSTLWYNGPFYTTEFDPEYETVQVKNPSYWDADTVQLEEVRYRTINDAETAKEAYSSGDIDYFVTSDENMYTDGIDGEKPVDSLTAYSFYVSLNNDSSRVTSDADLREALYFGFNKDAVNEGASGPVNKTIDYLIPEGITGVTYDGLEYRDIAGDGYGGYDAEKGKEALERYMEKEGISDPSEVEVEFLVNDSSGGKKTAEAIQAEYKNSLGITVEATILPSSQYVEKRNEGEFDLASGGWGPDYADPSTYIDIFKTANIGSVNAPRYSNPDFDSGAEAAAVITDPEARMEAYAELEKQLMDGDHAIIPFYQKNEPYFLKEGYTIKTHLFLKISDKFVEVSE